MSKSKMIGGGIVVTIVALAVVGISKLFDGGTGFGLGTSGGGAPVGGGTTSITTKRGDGAGGALVITLEGEKYLLDGSPRSFDDVVAAAAEFSKTQSDRSDTPILLKKKGTARYMSVQKLEDELKRRGIRYRSENDY